MKKKYDEKRKKSCWLAIASQKGGVGKSVFTVLLASVSALPQRRACGGCGL